MDSDIRVRSTASCSSSRESQLISPLLSTYVDLYRVSICKVLNDDCRQLTVCTGTSTHLEPG